MRIVQILQGDGVRGGDKKMTELESATVEEIGIELLKRQQAEHRDKIATHVCEIRKHHEAGRIKNIETQTMFRGTSAETKSYHVHLK
jgi:hypothetical protein